ncbi:MAG: hypothetical protein HS126_40255 [Anaerolineales bacterium]|nr:hypothetical protein [Anaerolineales bacterium]
MFDLGVTRTIDHAVYIMLNALAIWLWRLDAALLGVSMLSYGTQDWLTGSSGGGVWQLSRFITQGLLNENTWRLFLLAALMLFGLSLVARPFISFQPVEIGRLFFFAALSYTFISQGVSLMRDMETWRSEAGAYIYEAMSGGGAVTVPVPGGTGSGSEPLPPPRDLDGSPLRGWEAVATSYFMVNSVDELHEGVPPRDLRLTYCLYDPSLPINDQAEENAEGCSPRKAWDEWDQLSFTLPITNIWGIPLPGSIEIDYPLYQEHPENRQLGLRQAQAGVARLALGPIVALFPIIEANVGLLLTLAASFIYLTMPLALLFSFFVYTESMVTRLLLQWIAIFIRTLILHGLIAVFLMILIGAAQSGSLTVYLGLVGVGIVGGFFLVQMASSIMKESLSQSLGAIGTIWKGTATAALGDGARRPAEMTLGAAKLAASGAVLAATVGSPGGAWSTFDMADPAQATARSGLDDLKGSARKYGERPDAVSRLAGKVSDKLPTGGWEAVPALALAGWPTGNGKKAAGAGAQPEENSVDAWTRAFYEAKEKGYGQQQVEAEGRDLLGEKMSRLARESMERHSQAETAAALKAAQEVAGSKSQAEMFDEQGQLKPEAVRAVRERLGDQARVFQGKQGAEDLAVLAAVAAQPQKQVDPAQFRHAAAAASPGSGLQAPGRVVPQAVGLDPVAAGAHFSAMNRFARISEQAGLTVEQREQLLQEVYSDKGVSAQLRRQLETSLLQQEVRGQAVGLRIEDVIASAEAMPRTLQGPMAVQMPGEAAGQPAAAASPTVKPVSQPKEITPAIKSAPQARPEVEPARAAVQIGSNRPTKETRAQPLMTRAPPRREKQA